MEYHLFVLVLALIVDWLFGEPDWLWGRFGHPVAWFGRLIALLERQLNLQGGRPSTQYRDGALTWICAVAAALAAGALAAFAIELIAGDSSLVGFVLEALVVSVFLAQKSLRDHVAAVAIALRADGIEGGRRAVGKIVGRDPEALDEPAICRAAVESLAENFSDGVVAPAFWYAVFGLPGLLAYKMINTADSMIGHKSEKYLHFGRVAAQADDLANWLPARLSALVIALGGGIARGSHSMRTALAAAFHDAGLHPSPNAGWPEAAMAGAGGFALGGPRRYGEVVVRQSWLNAAGRTDLGPGDIDVADAIFERACNVLWVIAAAGAILI